MRALLIASLLLSQGFVASHADAGRFLKRRRARQCRPVCPTPCPTPYRTEIPTSMTMYYCEYTQICRHESDMGVEETQVYGQGMGPTMEEAQSMAYEMLKDDCDMQIDPTTGELLGEAQMVYCYESPSFAVPVRGAVPCKSHKAAANQSWYSCKLCVRYANGLKIPVGELGHSPAQAYAKACGKAHELARLLGTRICFVTRMGCECIQP